MSPVFTVVVPVYNEAGFIPTALPMLVAAVDDVGVPYRVLLIENGSTDSTAETARRVATGPEIEVISIEEADYGRAMREGFRLARSEWVVNFDIDYFSAGFLRAVLEQPDDVDIVIASKRDPGSDDRRPFIRRLATRVFNLLLRTILDSRVTDTHGMKGFRSDLVRNLEPDVISNQDLFDTELV
ncbi:MAG: glycosyltransferase family 2 protein, partial [Acidimicrobiia bacterium]